jgi:hypothetical protein
MNKRMKIFLVGAIVLSFKSGQQYQQFHYDDLCLDAGGGRNPGDYPICIIERWVSADNQ